jgi:hypothetical protein
MRSDEFKVGDVVSIFESEDGIWLCTHIINEEMINELKTDESLEAYRGVHPSLIPKGWQLAPIEPTEDMILNGRFEGNESHKDYPFDIEACYAGMLKAVNLQDI